jgi:hypothetical protein
MYLYASYVCLCILTSSRILQLILRWWTPISDVALSQYASGILFCSSRRVEQNDENEI